LTDDTIPDNSGKNRALLFRFPAADGDNVVVDIPRLIEIEDRLRHFTGDVYPLFLKDLCHQGIANPRLQPDAFSGEPVDAVFSEEFFGHLAPGAVVNTDK